MTNEKMPCRFCHENNQECLTVIRERVGSRHSGWVECQNCGARGPTAYSAGSAEEAESLIIYNWNDGADIHDRRVTDLLESNNALLERARKAEAALNEPTFAEKALKDFEAR